VIILKQIHRIYRTINRVLHTNYGINREMEFKHTKHLFGPYKKDLYWSSTRGGLIKEEEQASQHQPKVLYNLNAAFIKKISRITNSNFNLVYNHIFFLIIL